MDNTTLLTELVYDQIADSLAGDGYIILPNFLPDETTQQLYKHVCNLPDKEFKMAGVGRNNEKQVDYKIRSDQTSWLASDAIIENAYLSVMEECRKELNRRLFLGLFDYEAHFAHYAKGSYYQRHIDAFKGLSSRVITTVFYLNSDWNEEHGGELVIYSPDSNEVLHRILPKFGKMVIFLSDRFPHEVLAAKQDRYSISGWFRVNNSNSLAVDPFN
ncbi:MAG: 2OG-Fe(II) oxygenase [Methylophaga sp.]|nr:2OG-Fe(II) oxygenase [Methylophaga sp.]